MSSSSQPPSPHEHAEPSSSGQVQHAGLKEPKFVVEQALTQAAEALDALRKDSACLEAIEQAARTMCASFRNQGRVFAMGNGGSMSDAMHFAEELTGKYRDARPPLPALAISDPGYLSCVSNDFGYEYVFERFLAGHARRGDCALLISTSGQSKNILKAAEWCQQAGVSVITLTGKKASRLLELSDVGLVTPGTSGYADRIQELHIKVIHILIELIEREMFAIG